jgi:hypothetical protein
MEEIKLLPTPAVDRHGKYVGCISEAQSDAAYAKAFNDCALTREAFTELLRTEHQVERPEFLDVFSYRRLMDISLPAISRARVVIPALVGAPVAPLPAPKVAGDPFFGQGSPIGCLDHRELVIARRRAGEIGLTAEQLNPVLLHYLGVPKLEWVRKHQHRELMYHIFPSFYGNTRNAQ